MTETDFQRADKTLNNLFPKRAIKKVLFVVPPDADESMFNFATARRGRYWNYPPYGLGSIASHLRKDDITVEILNLNNEILKVARNIPSEDQFSFSTIWQEALHKIFDRFNPDFIGISCMFSQTHKSMVEVLNFIKDNRQETPISLGGVHITNCFINESTSQSLITDLKNADFFFLYEAELAMRKFIQIVNKKTDSSELSQVFFNNLPERLYFDKRLVPSGEDLDILPAHDLMLSSELSSSGTIGSFYCLKEDGTKFATVLSNRGCRARCTFCSVRNFNGDGVRSRSVQSVIDELLMLKNDFGIGHIMWLDDDFLKGHDRTLTLFNEMVRQNVGITWDCTNGVIAASCTDELMSGAVASGCLGFNIGMESGNPKILRDIRKPGTVDTFLEAAEIMRKYEQINARVFLMIGFPGESYRMILDTIDVALAMNLDWYNVTILQPLPNTPIFNSMISQGLIKDVQFTDIHYNSGAYGKHRKMAELRQSDLLSNQFQDAFNQSDLDMVPPKEQLDDIWAYMNYHLNFKRLFSETRPVKLMQQFKYVQNITDLVAPENAFAMYFFGYLQKRVTGSIDSAAIERLSQHLIQSPYWQERFYAFQLSVDHLRSGVFPDATKVSATEHLHAHS